MSSAVDRLFQEYRDARRRIGLSDGDEAFLRGHANTSWGLLPTLHRFVGKLGEFPTKDRHFPTRSDGRSSMTSVHVKVKSKRNSKGSTRLDNVESAAYWEFRAKCFSMQQQLHSGWDYLFLARHHGIPTRVMDWTENLLVAVYFAICDSCTMTDSCIWVLNPYRLNLISMGSDDIYHPLRLCIDQDSGEPYDFDDLLTDPQPWPWQLPVALYPEQRSIRQHVQSGWFTIHGSSDKSLESQHQKQMKAKGKRGNLPFLTKIVIPVSDHGELRELVSLAGWNRYTIYQDLDNLARTINERLSLL